MKVVISGASGFIGSALVPALRSEGHDVIQLVRSEPRDTGELRWDPAVGSLDPSSLAGVEAIICLNGATIAQRWTAARKREIL
jgi:uncharacterized protein